MVKSPDEKKPKLASTGKPVAKYASILYVCPGCNDRFTVREWYYSKDRWCPKCGVQFQYIPPTKEL